MQRIRPKYKPIYFDVAGATVAITWGILYVCCVSQPEIFLTKLGGCVCCCTALHAMRAVLSFFETKRGLISPTLPTYGN